MGYDWAYVGAGAGGPRGVFHPDAPSDPCIEVKVKGLAPWCAPLHAKTDLAELAHDELCGAREHVQQNHVRNGNRHNRREDMREECGNGWKQHRLFQAHNRVQGIVHAKHRKPGCYARGQ